MFSLNRSPEARARFAVAVFFMLNGWAAGLWTPYIPQVQRDLGFSDTLLGLALIGGGVGGGIAIMIMTFSRYIDRLGSHRAMMIGAVVLTIALPGPGLAGNYPILLAALVFMGLGMSVMDVSMNAHAVVVEQRYRRPIMSSFHGFWSMGTALGAGTGGLSRASGLGLETVLIGGAIVVIALSLTVQRFLLPTSVDRHPHATRASRKAEKASGIAPTKVSKLHLPAIVWVLTIIAACSFIAEGTVGDWSAKYLEDYLGVAAGASAIGFTIYAAMMMLGRFTGDRVVSKLGPVTTVRVCGMFGFVGSLLVVIAPGAPVAVVGWALFGIGLSCLVPQVFTAAGQIPGVTAGSALSIIAGGGYISILAGPGLIGPIAGATNLRIALILPILLCAITVLAAKAVRIAEKTFHVDAPADTAGSGASGDDSGDDTERATSCSAVAPASSTADC